MPPSLQEFELHVGLTASKAATLLGYARQTYYQYRRSGAMPLYAQRHVEAIMLLPRSDVINLIRNHVNDRSDDNQEASR